MTTAQANGCVVGAKDVIRKLTDVKVEGTFFIASADRGTGYIIPKLVEQGRWKSRYKIMWDPHEAEINPDQAECMLQIPESGSFEVYNLQRQKDGTYAIIGRGVRVRK